MTTVFVLLLLLSRIACINHTDVDVRCCCVTCIVGLICVSACWAHLWAVQKRLNRFSFCSWDRVVWIQRTMLVHIGATWQMRLNDPWAVAMRPYVTLLWPLVCCWQNGAEDVKNHRWFRNVDWDEVVGKQTEVIINICWQTSVEIIALRTKSSSSYWRVTSLGPM